MELTLEAYYNIVNNVGSRAEIAALCRVSKGFRFAAEYALYNALDMRNTQATISLCDTLSSQPRLAALVDSLTISGSEEADEDEDEDGSPVSAEEYWSSVSRALQSTKRLRHLMISVIDISDTSTPWILHGCTFRLRSFHCDLEWDHNLISFLNSQVDLNDLYIIDYNDFNTDTPTNVSPSTSACLDIHSLPNLSTLECTFAEAAIALVPSRPVTHLKTCFSRSEISEKRTEMSLLFSKIRLSTHPLRSLDVADSSYTEAFCMEFLESVVKTSATTSDLRYLGTLVLPMGGREVRVVPLLRLVFSSMTTVFHFSWL